MEAADLTWQEVGSGCSNKSIAMSLRRLKAPPTWDRAYYHCTSRTVDQRFVFGESQKEYFLGLMREYEVFCGVRVLTYTLLSNHFHMVVEVPARPSQENLPSAQEILGRLEALSGHSGALGARQRYERLVEAADSQGIRQWLESYYRRMWNISEYMKLIKQRFTQWYNRCQKRSGTLWGARFWSVLVEPGRGLMAVGLYTDLNSVRAGLSVEPEDYRWSGYGQGMGGDRKGQMGIVQLVRAILGTQEVEPWEEAARKYRMWLYVRGDEQGSGVDERGRPLKAGIEHGKVLEVLRGKGKVAMGKMVRCRVRYFTHGKAIGSRAFVEGLFEYYRQRFGKNRKSGARRIRGLSEELYVLRDLRVDRFG